MWQYIIKRVLGLIPLVLVVSFVIFMFIHLIPGDPARLIAGKEATYEEVQQIRESLGLEKPLFVQYFDYLKSLLSGDLGYSIQSGAPVSELIGERIMPTLGLTFLSIGWALVVGILLGIISAVFRNKWPDYLGMLTAVSGISLPNFWVGLVLIQLFSVQLGLLPTGGADGWQSYLMPSFALGAGIMAMIARFTRSSLVNTLKQDYIRTGRAKGLGGNAIIFGHALKNSLIPVVTIAGLQFGFLLGGSVVVETVFSFPGLGRLLIDSIQIRDYPVVQAEILLFSLQFILVNLLVDIIYSFLNPKIRYE
ncbi:MAG: ABC transporter permease subunit [Bacillota bacterium]|uniref:Glutathione transport system permease protein GsiC n=1 Tax=Virgibacillus salarius TaxID=447199 RepID=A0A941DT72_9BACI|nr:MULTISPECIES: ABC transporter permease subunit [Virgibacillus]NAZ07770.1 ABC transporter permease subunit [Agaribacter marinus]MBR7795052.1 ABC transporter permease subunit [Virgibacillus salarius]MCC2248443.1 ABC transporter permease subunit [Virgibacillus sp. AGTR]MDY7043122.1 ABC transporter permease subunit [Virgibacillus sp. M23]QRZ16691.1 ABC transporter permease subunit [Virgibacillus sp. AGTR]